MSPHQWQRTTIAAPSAALGLVASARRGGALAVWAVLAVLAALAVLAVLGNLADSVVALVALGDSSISGASGALAVLAAFTPVVFLTSLPLPCAMLASPFRFTAPRLSR